MSKADEIAKLAVLLALNAKPHKYNLDRSGPMHHYAIQDAKAIIRQANTITRWGLAECVGVPKGWDAERREPIMGWDETDTERAEKAHEKCRQKIAEILRRYYLEKSGLEFQRDPRGHMVKVRFKNGGYWSA